MVHQIINIIEHAIMGQKSTCLHVNPFSKSCQFEILQCPKDCIVDQFMTTSKSA
jgi:hypothetical protein